MITVRKPALAVAAFATAFLTACTGSDGGDGKQSGPSEPPSQFTYGASAEEIADALDCADREPTEAQSIPELKFVDSIKCTLDDVDVEIYTFAERDDQRTAEKWMKTFAAPAGGVTYAAGEGWLVGTNIDGGTKTMASTAELVVDMIGGDVVVVEAS